MRGDAEDGGRVATTISTLERFYPPDRQVPVFESQEALDAWLTNCDRQRLRKEEYGACVTSLDRLYFYNRAVDPYS
jgi:hypothetical protein